MVSKNRKKSPEDFMLEAIAKVPHFDAEKAWKEIKKERRRERS